MLSKSPADSRNGPMSSQAANIDLIGGFPGKRVSCHIATDMVGRWTPGAADPTHISFGLEARHLMIVDQRVRKSLSGLKSHKILGKIASHNQNDL